MRLPMKGDHVDLKEFSKMVDKFIESGFNYFDTAHGYIRGESEKAIKKCLTSRYPRSAYLLTDKLTEPYFKKQEDILPFVKSQLEATGVDYFDYYLMHAQNSRNYEHFKKCRAYETVFELKKQGLIRHVGISFHDTAEVLEQILSDYPEIEVVQIQFNYLDYESPSVQSHKLYDICKRHNKPIIVMEPVKGGSLVNLPDAGKKVLDNLGGGSYASYALRFALHFPQIAMVLSGMSDLPQMEDNVLSTKDAEPLTDDEMIAIGEVRDIINGVSAIPCTKCRYCVEQNHCPANIPIPEIFSLYNTKRAFNDWNADFYYRNLTFGKNGKASMCIKCGKCEKACPQHLTIRDYLVLCAKEFE